MKKKKIEKFWLNKKGPKITRKGLVKKLDAAFSEFIRERDKKCVVCKTTIDLTCGHLFTRTAYSTRWDEVNCHCQCLSCNYIHESNPHPFCSWFIHKFGLEAYDNLIQQHKTIKKFSDYDIATLTLEYKRRTELLKDNQI
jgi:hypothetical protein